MSEKNEKIKNKEEILKQIQQIKSNYEIEKETLEEEELSFLDRLNRLIRLIMDDSSISVYQALDRESLENWKKKRFFRWLKNTFLSGYKNTMYLILLATITGFLVSEALSFYSIDGVIFTPKTYIKAILIETCFIFLNGYKIKGIINNIWVNFLRASIFGLMLFVISSQTLTLGTKAISEIEGIQKQIEFIEGQIKEKEKEIVYYRDVKNWPNNTRERILEKEVLVKKLISLKEEQAKGKDIRLSKIEEYKMYGRAIFRVLLLFVSVLITRRIFSF